MALGPQHVRPTAEDELHARLVGRGRHRAIELHHDATAGHARRQCRDGRNLLRTPCDAEDVVLGEAPHEECSRSSAQMSGDDGLGQAEALLEKSFLVGMQIVLQGRRHDDLDADQTPSLGPSDEPARRRPRHAELGGDLRLGESVEVVEGRRTEGGAGDLRASRHRSGPHRQADPRPCRSTSMSPRSRSTSPE